MRGGVNKMRIFNLTSRVIIGWKIADSRTWEVAGKTKRIWGKITRQQTGDVLCNVIIFSLAIWIYIGKPPK
jgi:hypothetical protein